MLVFTSRLLGVVSNINRIVGGPMEVALWSRPMYACDACQLDLLLELFY